MFLDLSKDIPPVGVPIWMSETTNKTRTANEGAEAAVRMRIGSRRIVRRYGREAISANFEIVSLNEA